MANKYSIVVSYKGHNLDKDKIIERLSPQERSGSGFCLFDGRRDISFSVKTEMTLKDKIKEFRKLAKEQKIRVKVEGYKL
ncbi:MAG: hypothetical protein EKK64_03445 [Neisseriaceae bacterium]|nr:MAG: hypothetical protein EKK64_03445 [Neisseriaceae bacterium]